MTSNLNINTTTQRASVLVRDHLPSHHANLLLLPKSHVYSSSVCRPWSKFSEFGIDAYVSKLSASTDYSHPSTAHAILDTCGSRSLLYLQLIHAEFPIVSTNRRLPSLGVEALIRSVIMIMLGSSRTMTRLFVLGAKIALPTC